MPERTALWQQSQELGSALRTQFQRMTVVGLGGSSMGARTLAEVFQSKYSIHQIQVCDNVDESEFARLLGTDKSGQTLEVLKQTVWLIISKSGSTIETLMTMDLLLTAYEQHHLDWKKHFVVITEPVQNPLAKFADAHGLKRAEVPLDVGGRFSSLSPVGMVPAAFLGLSVEKFRSGAKSALEQGPLISEVAAEVLAGYQRGEDITMFWSYCSHLREFGGWMNQLWAESLGKALNRAGAPAPKASTPFAAIGACDQHSVLQQVMEGPKNKFVVFQRVRSSESRRFKLPKSHFAEFSYMEGRSLGDLLAAEAQATSDALTQVGVQNMTLMLEELSEESIGELLMFWQLVVATMGECLEIDAFNQPGVELGKRLAKKILQA